jgi:hypothetical protein
MSLRDKTREVVEAGKAKRGDWQPEKGSWSERRYQYYHKRTGKGRENENFCRFWRVATIWATKEHWVERGERLAEKTDDRVFLALAVLTYLAIVGVLLTTPVWLAGVAIVAIPLAVVGLFSVLTLMGVGNTSYDEPLTDKERKWYWFFTALAFPVTVPVAGIVWVARHWPKRATDVLLGIAAFAVAAFVVLGYPVDSRLDMGRILFAAWSCGWCYGGRRNLRICVSCHCRSS